jgi:hypothetical protein
VSPKTPIRPLFGLLFIAGTAGIVPGLLHAQQLPATKNDPPPAAVQLQPTEKGAPPCIQPAPMVDISDYDGPFQKIVGTFARPLERKSVHAPHFLPGEKLCTFSVKDKFVLFLRSSYDPVAFVDAGFNAGLDQAQNSDPSYHQGAKGYARRFAAEVAGQTSSRFFSEFAYPSIFHEDPRYYRKVHGPAGRRLLHAVGHSVLAHRDNGNVMFNFSEWLGTSSSVILSNTYHPDNKRGFAPAATRVGYSVLQDVGFDVLREFWPEISRKFKLPFRGQNEALGSTPNLHPK